MARHPVERGPARRVADRPSGRALGRVGLRVVYVNRTDQAGVASANAAPPISRPAFRRRRVVSTA